MNQTLNSELADDGSQCPGCGHSLPYLVALFPFDAPCPRCGGSPWCRVTNRNGSVVMTLLPRRTPSLDDISRFTEHHLRSDGSDRVVCDLREVAHFDSSTVASLLTLNKQIRSKAGHLVLCGMGPFVRQVLVGLCLLRLFETAGDEPAVEGLVECGRSAPVGPVGMAAKSCRTPAGVSA